MTATDEQDRKKMLSLSRPGRLELKKTVETGQVRQSFPHGRSKTVTVEVRKKRSVVPGPGEKAEAPATGGREAAPASGTATAGTPAARRAPIVIRSLTAEEGARRVRALQDAK